VILRCPICHDGERTIAVMAPIQTKWEPAPKPRVVLHCEVTDASPDGFRWWTTCGGLESVHLNYSGPVVNAALKAQEW
jgi:hypothetical protein